MLTETIRRWLIKLLERTVMMLRSASLEDLDKRVKKSRRDSVKTILFKKDMCGSKTSKHPGTQETDVSTLDDIEYVSTSQVYDTRTSRCSSSKRASILSAHFRKESLAVPGDVDIIFMQNVRINLSGRVFFISKDYLNRYPETRLGSLSPDSKYFNRLKREYYFDRCSVVFDWILDFYRTSELHLPRNVCGRTVVRELDFWGIPVIWVSGCCWAMIHDAVNEERLAKILRGKANQVMPPRSSLSLKRRRLWSSLFDRQTPIVSQYVWNGVISLLILLSAVLFFVDAKTEILPWIYFKNYLDKNVNQNVTLNSALPPRRNIVLWRMEVAIVTILGLEFVFKLAVCPSIRQFFSNILNTLYCLSLLGTCVAIITESILEKPTMWVNQNTLDGVYLFGRCIRWLRVIRLMELLDFRASLYVMWVATLGCHNELLLLLIVFLTLAGIFGAITFFVEQISHCYMDDKREQCSDLSSGLYWAVITMTTVGYGDIAPTTPLGRVVGSLCSLCGVIVLALPVAILTETFQQYSLRHKIRLEKRRRQEDFFRHVFFLHGTEAVKMERASI